MTRLITIGDIHLSSANPGNEQRLRSWDQIIDENQHAHAWVLTGVIFHAKSTVEDRNAAAARFQRMAVIGPVLTPYGNHDAPGDLDIFSRLEAPHPIYVVDCPRVVRFESCTGAPLAAWVLPYPFKAGLVGAGVAHGDLME